jgi:hypothetical protein
MVFLAGARVEGAGVEGAGVEGALMLDITEGKIVAVRTVANPDKPARLHRELGTARRVGGRVGGRAGPTAREAGGYEPAAAPGDLR